MLSPSIVPRHDGPLYFVLKDFGRHGTAFIETDPEANSREDIIDDLASGELDDVLQVIAVDIESGIARDVTHEFMTAAELKATA